MLYIPSMLLFLNNYSSFSMQQSYLYPRHVGFLNPVLLLNSDKRGSFLVLICKNSLTNNLNYLWSWIEYFLKL